MESRLELQERLNHELREIERPDLEFIYDRLKDKYELKLTNALSLDAGFAEDLEVLTGESSSGRFYLYFEAGIIFDTDGSHWHPEDTSDAMRYVVDFMEGKM